MLSVIQRSLNASVTVNEEVLCRIDKGLVLLLGIIDEDGEEDVQWLAKKIVNLRIFDDENGVMNKSIIDSGGEVIVVSQFTLHASTKKGNRPSYIKAAKPDVAIPLYNRFIEVMTSELGKKVHQGKFGADMKIELINDGPVTIIIDTKDKK